LVNEVFPELRRRARERFVEVIEVDLRWGITEEEAEQGGALSICVREVLRARPYFLGMLGERYGWVPDSATVREDALLEFPWLRGRLGVASMTELEILSGLLESDRDRSRTLFYFRAPQYADQKGPEFKASDSREQMLLAHLKSTVERSGAPILKDYVSPSQFAAAALEDLWRRIDSDFPLADIPSPDERERWMQTMWASERTRHFTGRESCLRALAEITERALASSEEAGTPPIAVVGSAGIGKSAVLAEWVSRHAKAHPRDLIFDHYGQSGFERGAAGWVVERLRRWVMHVSGVGYPKSPLVPSELAETDGISDAPLDGALREISRLARQSGCRAVVVLDGLQLEADGRWGWWLPALVPPDVVLLVAPAGDGSDEMMRLRGGPIVRINPLQRDEAAALVSGLLASHSKRLSMTHIQLLAGSRIAAKPSTLRWIVDEMRLAATHDDLGAWVQQIQALSDEREWVQSVFDRLERDLPDGVAGRLLATLALASTGIHENDLAAISGVSTRSVVLLQFRLGAMLESADSCLRMNRPDLRDAAVQRWLPSKDRIRVRATSDASWWIQALKEGRASPEQAVPEACSLLLQVGDPQRLREILGTPEVVWHLQSLGPGLRACVAAEADSADGTLETVLESALSERLEEFCAGAAGLRRACTVSDILAHVELFGSFHERLLQLALDSSALVGRDETARILRNAWASLLQAHGRSGEACAEFVEVLRSRQQSQDWPAAEDLVVLSNLAGALISAGREAEALECVDAGLKLAGAQGSVLARRSEAILLNSRATLLRRRGDLDAALLACRAALKQFALYEGRQSSGYLICAMNLAVNLSGLGHHGEAERILMEGLDCIRATFGRQSAQYGRGLANLGRAVAGQGRSREGITHLRAAVEILGGAAGTALHWGSAANLLATELARAGDLDESLRLMREIAVWSESVARHPDPEVLETTFGNLARACAVAGRWSEAAEWWIRIHKLLQGDREAQDVPLERVLQLFLLVMNAIMSRKRGGLSCRDLVPLGEAWYPRVAEFLEESGSKVDPALAEACAKFLAARDVDAAS